MRPQTWSKAKPLVGVAGRTALDYLLDMFKTIPAGMEVEYVFIVGPYLGEGQIPSFLQEHYPDHKVRYLIQKEMRGQSDALWLARQYLVGPTIICFSDTLIETDFSFLAGEKADGVAWVKHVPDPRRFGVAEVNRKGWITRLIEKPDTSDNTLVVVGCYYFREGWTLVEAIQEQLKRGAVRKGEFYLADAINIMAAGGAHIRPQAVDIWLDTGTIDATLATNRYLLEHGQANRTKSEKKDGVEIVPPVYIHDTAEVKDSIIGPHASIGPGCRISNSRVENSIIEDDAIIESAALKDSFVGRQASVKGRSPEDAPMALNISDDSSVRLV